MSIRVCIYDFYAYVIPGSLLITVAGYGIHLAHIMPICMYNPHFSFVAVAAFLVLAYVSGFIMDPITYKFWIPFFRAKKLSELVLNQFKTNHKNFQVNFKASDWPVLQAFIARQHQEMHSEIQRFNALQIMLRNISFALLILALVQAIFLLTAFSFLKVMLVIGSFILSMITAKQSVTLSKWFYSAIYEAVVAHSLDVKTLVKKDKK